MKRILLVWFSVASLALSVRGQDFTNLGFESAKVIVNSSGYVATSNALSGWSLFAGTNQLSEIRYNFTPGPPPQLQGSNANVIAGNFDIWLAGGSISQSGLVPNGTESLLFAETSSSVLVSLGGQSLSFMAISNAFNSFGNPCTIYGADISGFAGQVETLTFTGGSLLDDIQFSTIPIPEPSVVSFLFLGSGVLSYVCKRRRFQL